MAPLQVNAQTSASAFKLAPETRVKISVVEWVETEGDYKEWTALSGEYVIAANHQFAMPIVGEISTFGKTVSQVALVVAEQLKVFTGLTKAPSVSVQVIQYPPVFIAGTVEKPGAIEYRPGLTVLQAVSLAGGRERRNNQFDRYSDFDQIRYTGELDRIDLALAQQLARRSRLQAELAQKPALVLPAEFEQQTTNPTIAQIKQTETTLFNTRTDALRSQLDSLSELGELLEREIVLLEEKMVTQDRQIVAAKEELNAVTKLYAQRTVNVSRKTGLERVVADLESSRLDMIVATMRAKQKLSETGRDAVSLKSTRQIEVSRDLQLAETEMEELIIKRGTTRQLLRATGGLIAENNLLTKLNEQGLTYKVVRASTAQTFTDLSEQYLLLPGDLLQVNVALSFNEERVARFANIGTN
nr:polysaccharide biosynthesis/export family protein [Ahrensia sp. 13_GOM-1096m]